MRILSYYASQLWKLQSQCDNYEAKVNLQVVFVSVLSYFSPCGESMIVMIDDRQDVWHYAPGLIEVMPYLYFKDKNSSGRASIPILFYKK